jgi:hypothetical protein
MARDKIGGGESHAPRTAVGVVPFEIESTLAFDNLAHYFEHDPMGAMKNP